MARARWSSRAKNGSALRVYRVLVTDGVEGQRRLSCQSASWRKPVDRIIAVGKLRRNRSRRAPSATGARSVELGDDGEGDRQTIAVSATAYAPGSDGVDWRTATGARAGLGVIAVDPKVIPLGARIYVPGYGYGVAADTGGAIKGSRIDLCFEHAL